MLFNATLQPYQPIINPLAPYLLLILFAAILSYGIMLSISISTDLAAFVTFSFPIHQVLNFLLSGVFEIIMQRGVKTIIVGG